MPLAVSWVSLQDVGVSAGLNYPLAVELLGGNDGVFLAPSLLCSCPELIPDALVVQL